MKASPIWTVSIKAPLLITHIDFLSNINNNILNMPNKLVITVFRILFVGFILFLLAGSSKYINIPKTKAYTKDIVPPGNFKK